jgi:hypothetical protein
MADERRTVPYLRSVPPRPASRPLPMARLRASTWQRTLFISGNSALLVFVDFDQVSENDLVALITESNARFVIELRPVPRFDVGSLSRKSVFALFTAANALYLDISGTLGVTHARDANLNPGLLASHLRDALLRTRREVDGPIIFLVESTQFTNEYVTALSDELQTLRSVGWEVLRFPVTSPRKGFGLADFGLRELVFISHANPEDNEFTEWLGIQLSLLGYKVWSDITKIMGGDTFWNTIEEAIREHAAKVVIVVSRAGQEKAGLLDEINCAVSFERASALENFVIPARIDDIPFDEIRANLARKDVIDFSGNWAAGLLGLLDVLERDRVPRGESNIAAVAAWARTRNSRLQSVVHVSEPATSNWLRITRLPENLAICLRQELSDSLGKPGCLGAHVSFGELVVKLRGRGLDTDTREESHQSTADALVNGIREPLVLDRAAVRNIVISLLRQLWAAHASSKGLLSYELASGAVAWYAPIQLIPGDFVSFRDLNGKIRRKYLLGRSEKRRVYWHYAIEARPVIGRTHFFSLISHVVFTEDGVATLVPTGRMHALRRQFCKNWWNDRWRDLMLAYLTYLKDEDDAIVLRDGYREILKVGVRPILFKTTVSVRETAADEHFSKLAREMEWEDLDVVDSDEEEMESSADDGQDDNG